MRADGLVCVCRQVTLKSGIEGMLKHYIPEVRAS